MNTFIKFNPEFAIDPNAYGYSTMDDQARLDTLKVKDIVKYKHIIVLDIQRYLNLKDMLIDFESATSSAAIKAQRTFELHDTIDMTNQFIRDKFTAVLAALVADTTVIIGTTEESYILSLGSTLIARHEELKVPLIETNIGTVSAARGLT